jgi:uncharacterized protein (DUF58 family)
MRTTTGSALVVGVAAVVCVLVMKPSNAAQVNVQPVPGPGSGVVTVTGKVEISNVPDVGASQRGDWKADVRVTNTPTVALESLPFLKPGSRYEVTWANGDKETVRVVQAAPGGWARVESSARTRWVNLTVARSVDEMS